MWEFLFFFCHPDTDSEQSEEEVEGSLYNELSNDLRFYLCRVEVCGIHCYNLNLNRIIFIK